MKTTTILNWIPDHFAIVVIAVSAVSMIVPATFTWMPLATINWLLSFVMFGMGLTLKVADFKVVLVKPMPVLVGFVAQFAVMPFSAWLLCRVFQLPTEIAIGVILVGCCPGGTASNIMTFLAKGDTALSVCMTAMTTLSAPLLTPLLTLLLAGKSIDVEVVPMMMSVVQVVILPIVAGLVAMRFFGEYVKRVLPAVPMLCSVSIAVIVGIVLSANASMVLTTGFVIMAVCILHNVVGLALGFAAATVARLSFAQRATISIEVGMQNAGLATTLAAIHFAAYPLATIPGAVFSVWHNFSGAIYSSMLRRMAEQRQHK